MTNTVGRVLTLLGLVSLFLSPAIGGSCAEPVARSPFLVKNLSIQPAKVQPNELVTITVSVTNTHDTWGIYSLVLQINGVEEAEQQANVDGHGTERVSFRVTKQQPGKYRVFINGLSGSFSVRKR